MTTSEDRILKLADKIRRFRAEGADKNLSERDTNVLLVEELLQIAGWPTDDPSQVSREDYPTERPVDYSLKIGGKPVVLVESKRLANQLTSRKHIEQALSYASSAGVRWCVLTNGCLFRVYNSLAPVVAEKKLVEEVDLATVGESDGVSPDRAVQILELISPQSIETGRIDHAWDQRHTGAKIREVVEELWAKPDAGLVNLVRQHLRDRGVQLNKKETEHWLGTLDVKVRTASTTVPRKKAEPEASQPPQRPTHMRLGGYAGELKYSYEILTKTAEWLIQQGKLRASDCPVPTGRKRYLVNREARHPDGAGFTAPRQLSNGLWLETHFSTKGCTRNAKRLLEAGGYSTDILEVA